MHGTTRPFPCTDDSCLLSVILHTILLSSLTLSRVPVKIVGGAAWADLFWCSSYRCIYAWLEALGSLAVNLIIVEA